MLNMYHCGLFFATGTYMQLTRSDDDLPLMVTGDSSKDVIIITVCHVIIIIFLP